MVLDGVPKVASVAKHKQISDAIHQMVRDRRIPPGSKLPGEQVLAKQFGVSHVTIRQAKKSLTQQGILYNISCKGTFVAENALAIRVAVFSRVNIVSEETAYALRKIIQELETQCASQMVFRYYGDTANRHTTRNGAMELLDQALAGQTQVVLLAQEMPELERVCRERRVPVVTFSNDPDKPANVAIHGEKFIQLATDYFEARDVREIGLIGRRDSMLGRLFEHRYTEDLKGWPKDWLANQSPFVPENGLGFEESGYRQFTLIWSAPRRPRGLLVLDDVMLRGAAFAMLELGIHPGPDLNLVSHYNAKSKMFIPFPFARIETDLAQYAGTTADLLRKLAEDPSRYLPGVRIEPRLVI